MDHTANIISNVIAFACLFGATIWVYIDAKMIGTDRGQIAGLVNTKPAAWAIGVFLILILALPLYLMTRPGYKRLAAKRKAEHALIAQQTPEGVAEIAGTWPPAPNSPTA